MLVAPLRVPRSRSGRRPDPETPAKIERRRQALEPLFAYMARYHIAMRPAVRHACQPAGVEPFGQSRIQMIQCGRCVAPEWFVERCCEAMGRTVAEVMGDGWSTGSSESGSGTGSGTGPGSGSGRAA